MGPGVCLQTPKCAWDMPPRRTGDQRKVLSAHCLYNTAEEQSQKIHASPMIHAPKGKSRNEETSEAPEGVQRAWDRPLYSPGAPDAVDEQPVAPIPKRRSLTYVKWGWKPEKERSRDKRDLSSMCVDWELSLEWEAGPPKSKYKNSHRRQVTESCESG